MELKTIKELVNSNININIDNTIQRREFVEARALYYALCKEYTIESLATIGRSVNKNHATVIHGLKNFPIWSDQSVSLSSIYLDIKSKLELLQDEMVLENNQTDSMLNKYLKIKQTNEKLIEVNKQLVSEINKLNNKIKNKNILLNKKGIVFA